MLEDVTAWTGLWLCISGPHSPIVVLYAYEHQLDKVTLLEERQLEQVEAVVFGLSSQRGLRLGCVSEDTPRPSGPSCLLLVLLHRLDPLPSVVKCFEVH